MLLSNISLADASLVAGLGYAVVFFGLILLMLVVLLVGKCFTASAKRKAAAEPVIEPVQAPAPKEAPGTAGQLKLHNVDPRTAAMLMAIVANKLQKPINELRFLSIKEVSE